MTKKTTETKEQRELREAKEALADKEQALARAEAFLEERTAAIPKAEAVLREMWERYESTLADADYAAIGTYQRDTVQRAQDDLPLASKRVEIMTAAIPSAREKVVDAELAVIRASADRDAALAKVEALGSRLSALLPELADIYDSIAAALEPIRDARARERETLSRAGRIDATEDRDVEGNLVARIITWSCKTPEVSLADALRVLRTSMPDARWDDVARLFSRPDSQAKVLATLPSVEGNEAIEPDEPPTRVLVLPARPPVQSTLDELIAAGPKTDRRTTYTYGSGEEARTSKAVPTAPAATASSPKARYHASPDPFAGSDERGER